VTPEEHVTTHVSKITDGPTPLVAPTTKKIEAVLTEDLYKRSRKEGDGEMPNPRQEDSLRRGKKKRVIAQVHSLIIYERHLLLYINVGT